MYSSVTLSTATTTSHNRQNNVKRNNNNLICNSLCNSWSLFQLSVVDKVKKSCKCFTNMPTRQLIEKPPLTLIDNNTNSGNCNGNDIREATIIRTVNSLARHQQVRLIDNSLTHLPNDSTFSTSPDPTECRARSVCRNKHSLHSLNSSSGSSKTLSSMTHNTLLCALLMITCSCILINLCDAASVSTASGKTKKHFAPKAHFIKVHNQQKTSLSSLPSTITSSSSSYSSPIKFISIKRAATTAQQQKQPTKDNTKHSSTELVGADNDNSNQLTNESSTPVTINSVSKQLAATLISAAASTLAQTATESVLKAVQTGSVIRSTGSIGSSSHGNIKRPSKIYNLPVKFVSNGQPNNFVMGLKQHLASIKKSSANNKKSVKKTTNNKMGKTPAFKPNSKFIYLPLKYLSNAKPYMVKKGEY